MRCLLDHGTDIGAHKPVGIVDTAASNSRLRDLFVRKTLVPSLFLFYPAGPRFLSVVVSQWEKMARYVLGESEHENPSSSVEPRLLKIPRPYGDCERCHKCLPSQLAPNVTAAKCRHYNGEKKKRMKRKERVSSLHIGKHHGSRVIAHRVKHAKKCNKRIQMCRLIFNHNSLFVVKRARHSI